MYYYAIYWKGKDIVGRIVVQEDGTVPSFSLAKKVVRLAVSVNTKLRFFILHGRGWAHTVDKVWQKQFNLIEEMYQKYNVKMSQEVKQSFHEFMDVPKKILEEYRVIQESNRVANKIEQEVSGKVADESMENELVIAWRKMFQAKNNQHLLFMNTKESREEVIHFLSRVIPLWDLKGRWDLQKLKAQHRQMLFGKEEQEDVLDVQDDVTRKKAGEEEFEEILTNTRNPK